MARPDTVFMFSGQGSQYFQMGRQLFDGHELFRDWMLRLDELARPRTRVSVLGALYSDDSKRGDPFDQTLLTHPAIFMVEYALAQVLIHEGLRPDAVLGVSLGSFTAAAVAGFLDVEDALSAVLGQALALERSCPPGGMTAVMAAPALFEEEFLRQRSELAAVNFDSHFVVSAGPHELTEIEADLRAQGVGHLRLPVSLAFHSQWIDDARAPFSALMGAIPIKRGSLPLACCERAATLSELSPDYFWEVVRRPIRFREAAARLERQGTHRYVDVGPAGTLATFLKYGLSAASASTIHSILTPFGADLKNLSALLAASRH